MPTRSAICASSGEYTPPVNTWGSWVRSRRNAAPLLSIRVLSLTARLGRSGQRTGGRAPPAIGRALEFEAAAGAHLGAAFRATRAGATVLERHTAMTGRSHDAPPQCRSNGVAARTAGASSSEPAQALQYVADSRWIAQVAHVLVPHTKHASRVGTVSPQPHRPPIANLP